MLKKLKRKFIIINMLLVGIVIIIGLFAIDIFEYRAFEENLFSALGDGALSLDGDVHQEPTQIGAGGKSNVNISVYVVAYNPVTGETVTLSDVDSICMDEDILNYSVSFAVVSNEKSGKVEKYGLAYYKIEGAKGMKIAFADYSYVTDSIFNIVIIEAGAFALFMIVLYFISLFLAKTAIRPIEDTWTRQKQFIADASHELKTPLTVIMANSGIMRSHAEESVKSQMAWIDSTDEESRHMKALVEEMLSLSKNEAGAGFIKQDVDLSKTVNRIFLQYEAVAFEKNVSLACSADDGIIISGDVTRIKQLVMILIDNALKYEQKGGGAEISLKSKGSFAILAVNNRSSRISEKDLPHVFDRFYRSDSSRSSDGFGLGLAIAKSIAELHGGSIAVSSDERTGVTFSVSLPALKQKKKKPNKSVSFDEEI